MILSEQRYSVILRILISLLGVAACLFLIYQSACFGFARLVGRYGTLVNSLPATTEAVRLAPADPDAHRARALVLRQLRLTSEAIKELELAASLRPRDDSLWLELGYLRDEIGDTQGALGAFDRAVTQAPYYAHTRWQRANLRLRLGRYDEAFAELRAAANSDRSFLPNLIDLAWSLTGDAKQVEQLAGIKSPEDHLLYARFLAKKGNGKATLEHFQAAANHVSDDQRREIVRELLWAHLYRDAFSIWSGSSNPENELPPQISDGGFEDTLNFDGGGFGWAIARLPKVQVSQDATEHESGQRSLRITFGGDSPPGASLVSQTIVVTPKTRYGVYFAAKARDVVSGGLPALIVTDADSNVTLSTSGRLPQKLDTWEKLGLEFVTPQSCEAIILKLARSDCQLSPCPIFGTLWLDSFSIVRLPDSGLDGK